MDIYRKIDSYRGYTYCVRRTAVGTVCCYIDVARDKRFSDVKSADDVPDGLIEAPGGLTYVASGFPGCELGQHEPFDEDLVIGYDYGHYNDRALFSHYGGAFSRMLSSDVTALLTSKISEADAEKTLFGIIDQLA